MVGVYLLDTPSKVASIAAELDRCRRYSLEQHWVALGAGTVPLDLEPLTRQHVLQPRSKFELLNLLLEAIDIQSYDFIVAIDDDIDLPARFLDDFIDLQRRYDLALAQPARTHDSYIDHHFTAQLTGIDARRTRFVEIGPLTSFRSDAAALLMPFDTCAPMGWGLDFVWPLQLERTGLQLGIVDATPVRHALRKPASHYDLNAMQAAMADYLSSTPHLQRAEAFVAFQTFDGVQSATAQVIDSRSMSQVPELSVLYCSYNRAGLLRLALDALCRQTLERKRFEVILVDDGSSDDTREVAKNFSGCLPLRYARQRQSGIASARNHALCLARSPIVCFLDDDDVADPGLLETHLRFHECHSAPECVVLGRTELRIDVAGAPLMHFVTQVRHNLFSYPLIEHGSTLGFDYFWGGRISCKRLFLLANGVFNPLFRFGAEDIELGYRLTKAGLRVIYNAQAVSCMVRYLTFEEYCRRSYLQGLANWWCGQLHTDPQFHRWCQIDQIELEWNDLEPRYDTILKIAVDLHRYAQARINAGLALDDLTLQLLHRGYDAAFEAARIKGSHDGSLGATPASTHEVGPERFMAHQTATA